MTRAAPRIVARHAGRTLIELIIAMAIGMVILIGVGALYLSSSGVSRTANQAGSAEDTGRVVMAMIGEGIKAGGYGEIVGSSPILRGQTLFDGPVVIGCSGSRFADAFNAATPDFTCTGAAPGDQVLFRFQGRYAVVPMDATTLANTALPDCLGASNANQDAVLNAATARPGVGTTRRMVQSAFSLDPGGTVLRCEGNGNPGVPTPIVNDVVDFRVFYRFDDGGYNLASTNAINYTPSGGSIRSATWINGLAAGSPSDPWLNVVGVIVCVTVATREQGTSLQTTTAAAPRCPRTEAEAAAGTALTEASADGRVRRTFIETFTVRSQATGAPSVIP